MTSIQTALFPEIEKVILGFNFESISEERKLVLQPLIDFVQTKANNKQEIRLNLICTHNSRRSHLSQVWAQTAAAYYDIKNV
ncbi:MAG: protein-tyrosine-phosphatase, partial [Flavobacteriales bacterium 32-34-25]